MNKHTVKFSFNHFLTYFFITSFILILSADAMSYDDRHAGPDQSVFFIEPRDNAMVSSEFKVIMGVQGMEIKPAGDMTDNSGHHHLLIDEQPVDKGEVIPNSETYLHFGKGQTETVLNLSPGRYTLILQFADGAHQSYGPAMRDSITVEVK